MLNRIKSLFIFLSIHLLNGCVIANGSLTYATVKEKNTIGYLPIGIPYLLGGHGSSVPITNELSLTAKHIALIDYSDVIAYHPHCDIAIIKQNNYNKTKATLGLIKQKQNLTTLGWGLFGRLITDKGKYFTDVNIINNSAYKNCTASITNASVQSGMSGGGVFNEMNELVGIITGIGGNNFRLLDKNNKLETRKISLFISSYHLKDWIFATLNKFYQKPVEQIAFKHNFHQFETEFHQQNTTKVD